MSEEKRMFEILSEGEQQEEMMLSLEHTDPHMPVVKKMLKLGYLEDHTVMFGGRIVQLTAAGLRALAQARAAGVETINWSQEHRPVHFQQTVHGTANTQVGDHNTMHVHVAGTPSDQLLNQLAELRALVDTLPEEDRDEVKSTIDRAEQAVKKGLMDRLVTYGPTLMTLAAGSVEFATKVKALFGL